jgi:homoserine dehydrogenase
MGSRRDRSSHLSPVPIVLLGFGPVGRALARQLAARPELPLVGLLTAHRLLVDERGLALDRGPLGTEPSAFEGPGPDPLPALLDRVAARRGPGILVDATPLDPVAGEPSRGRVEVALRRGWDVVTANKGPIAHAGEPLAALAAREGCRLSFGATVGGAVPILETLAGPIRASGLGRIEGIVNGTTQFLLGALSDGLGWEEALAAARAAGLTERDPAWDLDGVDARLKASILHWVAFGKPLPPQQVDVEPVGASLAERAAGARGERWVSLAEIERGRARVRLRVVERGGRWDLPGASNAFRLGTDRAGEIWLSGPGAGPESTASTLVGELLGLREQRQPRPVRLRRALPMETSTWGIPVPTEADVR